MKLFLTSLMVLSFTVVMCKKWSMNLQPTSEKTKVIIDQKPIFKDSLVYKSDQLVIIKITNHVYQHISYLNTNDFGKVACNGMVVINNQKGVIFDSPTSNQSALELINFVTKQLKTEISALIPTHFHNDCVGGISEFETQNIPTYISNQTLDLLKKNGQIFSKSVNTFNTNLTLKIGDKNVYCSYFGEGHTPDNIIGYFPYENAIFGGCLIKEIGASKGYLGDANIKEWSKTVKKIKLQYPEAKIVIPGHGNWGGIGLFDYTIKLFE